MHETYHMLGKEHEADLEREALNRRRAAEVAEGRRARAGAAAKPARRLRPLLARVAALVGSRSQ